MSHLVENLVKVKVVEVKVEKRDFVAKSEGKTKPPHNSSAAPKKIKGDVGLENKTSLVKALNDGIDAGENFDWSNVITN